ncbi:hypothetical protein BDU57DRAFT_509516 [Ampelomyces quisqualis]|uniref:Secreted protein n=1 Tax=Ampelomyces quisqualis TaxID=50730 RepID=A0A6A5QZT6_AMPQU|nr:hypothetical protein BDU57DRAFT_509516 [Ampelomyces quisqualis]
MGNRIGFLARFARSLHSLLMSASFAPVALMSHCVSSKVLMMSSLLAYELLKYENSSVTYEVRWEVDDDSSCLAAAALLLLAVSTKSDR